MQNNRFVSEDELLLLLLLRAMYFTSCLALIPLISANFEEL